MAKIDIEHIDEGEQEEYIDAPDMAVAGDMPEIDEVVHHKRGGLTTLIVLLLLVAAASTGYLLFQKRNARQTPLPASSQEPVQLTEAEQLHKKLGQTLDLPAEIPNLATVLDAQKVKNQLFFQKAQNGDKVLIYVKAGQAVLYRPSSGKVINLAPIALDTESSQGVR